MRLVLNIFVIYLEREAAKIILVPFNTNILYGMVTDNILATTIFI